MFSADCQNKLIETLEKLNMTLESFNNKNQNSEKGGEKVMNKFEELLAKYGKTADEVTFEYENLSDEELEVAFTEAFEEDNGDNITNPEGDGADEDNNSDDGNDSDNGNDGDGAGDGDDGESGDNDGEDEGSGESEEEPEAKFVLKYELSHDDIRAALYNLLAAEDEDNYYYAWILEVYDDKFIYQDYLEGKFYRQDYSKDGENVSLGENKVEVFNEWLSKAEKDALDALKEDYAALKEFKADTKAAQLQAQKDAIFAREEFANIVKTKAFTKLVENSKNYSIEECEQKAKDILDDCNDYMVNFAANDDGRKKPHVIGFTNASKPEKEKPYGDLFDD